jgi:hypothetical protein
MTGTEAGSGICSVPLAAIRAEPRHGAEQVSQLLLGEGFRIEERDPAGEWLSISCLADGYRGWLRSWYAVEISGEELGVWEKRAIWRCARRHESVHVEASKASGVVMPLPWGARVALRAESDGWIEVELPDGRGGFLPRRSLAEGGAPGGRPTPRRLLKTAAEFLGVPYAWGGRSSWGMDCSGFVQTVFAWHGVLLPRDSTDQMEWLRQGRRRAALGGVSAARAGDLLFFGPDTKTATHVAISSGGANFLHAQGEVRSSSLDPASELYENALVSSSLGVLRLPPGAGC